MTANNILRIGNPLLRQKSDLVDTVVSEDTRQVVDQMLITMKEANGAGLAAPQIGIPKRIIVFGIEQNPRYPDAESVPLTVLINPVFSILDSEEEAAWEGCLSIPGMRGKVFRAREIEYKGYSPDGELIERTATGFHARVFLHEYDHLEGILYVDKIRDLADFGFISELEEAGILPKVPAE